MLHECLIHHVATFSKDLHSSLAQSSLSQTLRLAKKNGGPVIIGEGDYQYEVDHNFAKLPDKFSGKPHTM
jgi:hypothetical protein